MCSTDCRSEGINAGFLYEADCFLYRCLRSLRSLNCDVVLNAADSAKFTLDIDAAGMSIRNNLLAQTDIFL